MTKLSKLRKESKLVSNFQKVCVIKSIDGINTQRSYRRLLITEDHQYWNTISENVTYVDWIHWLFYVLYHRTFCDVEGGTRKNLIRDTLFGRRYKYQCRDISPGVLLLNSGGRFLVVLKRFMNSKSSTFSQEGGVCSNVY